MNFDTINLQYVSACAGSGKTTAALSTMINGVIRTGQKYILAQPTKELINSTLHRLSFQATGKPIKYRAITSDTNPQEVRSEFIKAVLAGEEDIILTTHATMLSCWKIAGKSKWHLIVDEIPSVDQSFEENLSMTWNDWTQHIMVEDNPDADGVLDVHVRPESMAIAEKWAYNKPNDSVIKVTQPFWQMAVNEAYELHVDRANWQRAGYQDTAYLTAHGTLAPIVFSGWEKVTIMGANFENSLMYRIWQRKGVTFAADTTIVVSAPTHSEKTGKRTRIKYLTENNWSKSLRNKIGMDKLTAALASHVHGDYIWVANNDVDDADWKLANGKRLKPITHGLNSYMHHTQAIFLAALNDTPAHFKWLQKMYGIEGGEVSEAKAQEAAYQMVMRTNLRMPDDDKQVTLIVADRRTADYLCSLLPGSKQDFIDLGIKELGKGQRTRNSVKPAKTATERSQEHRKREEARLKAVEQLGAVVQEVNGALHLTDVPINVSFEESIYSTTFAETQFKSWDEFKDLLHTVWQNTIAKKEDNLLMSGARFSADEKSETKKGLDAFVYSQVLQLDFDDSEMDPDLVAFMLSDIRHMTYNSFNNGRDGLFRFRVVIPLAAPVDREGYETLWDIMAERVRANSFTVGKEKSRKDRVSGLDVSKRTPASWMYMPSQAKVKANSYWSDNFGVSTAEVLNPVKFLKRTPVERPDYIEVSAVDNRDEKLKALMTAINAPRAMKSDALEADSAQRKRDQYAEKLSQRWLTEESAGNMLSGMIPRWLAERGFSREEINNWYNTNFMSRPGWQAHKSNWDKQIKKYVI